jgi:hypothetical protein
MTSDMELARTQALLAARNAEAALYQHPNDLDLLRKLNAANAELERIEAALNGVLP